jgi:alanine racemase
LEVICDTAREKGIDLGVRHAASSAEVDRYPYAWLDMVRPGNCIVGLEPEKQANLTIKPVMSLKTRVVYVKTMLPGESLSYHRAYRIEKEMRIATLPCGYSDGYPAVVSDKAEVLIRGRRCPLVGPITANHMMVDVTGIDDVAIGDEVVLWGEQGDKRISKVELETLAAGATNTYRMSTRVPAHMPRVTR